MNLVEKLMQADASKCAKKESKTIKSKQLAKVIDEEEPVDIDIQEIDQRRLNEILAMQFDKKGRFEPAKAYDAQIMCVIEGVTYPPLKDKQIQDHFDCHTPKELAEKLFKGEAKKIADEIAELSGAEDADEEDGDVIKN